MNAEGLMSAGGLSKKIVSFLILIIGDIFISSFILFVDLSGKMGSDNNVNAPFPREEDIGIILSGI